MADPIHVEAQDVTEVADRLFHERADWFQLIKALRAAGNMGIFEAERAALAHDGWRRWCESRINSDPRCRKLAASHMRYSGAASLIEKEEDTFRVRTPPFC